MAFCLAEFPTRNPRGRVASDTLSRILIPEGCLDREGNWGKRENIEVEEDGQTGPWGALDPLDPLIPLIPRAWV